MYLQHSASEAELDTRLGWDCAIHSWQSEVSDGSFTQLHGGGSIWILDDLAVNFGRAGMACIAHRVVSCQAWPWRPCFNIRNDERHFVYLLVLFRGQGSLDIRLLVQVLDFRCSIALQSQSSSQSKVTFKITLISLRKRHESLCSELTPFHT